VVCLDASANCLSLRGVSSAMIRLFFNPARQVVESSTLRRRSFFRGFRRLRRDRGSAGDEGVEVGVSPLDKGAGWKAEGSSRIRTAHVPVVTADTSYVNPFLRTKLRKNKKKGVPRGTSQSALPIDRGTIPSLFPFSSTYCLPDPRGRLLSKQPSLSLSLSLSLGIHRSARLREPFVIGHICCARSRPSSRGS